MIGQFKLRKRNWGRITALVFAFAMCGAVAQAQQPVPRIGYLRFIEFPVLDKAFRNGLRELGYIEGQNIHIEYRFAGGSTKRLAELAAEHAGIR